MHLHTSMTPPFMRELGGAILNFTGGTLRWIYGSIWRTIFKKSKFTYREYIDGPKNSDDYFDSVGHRFNNIIIGIIFIGVVFLFVFR